MTHCDLLTVASRELEKRGHKMGIPADKIVYMPNGPGIKKKLFDADAGKVERERLGIGDRPTLLLYSRLFEFDTGRLIAVLTNLKEQFRSLHPLCWRRAIRRSSG